MYMQQRRCVLIVMMLSGPSKQCLLNLMHPVGYGGGSYGGGYDKGGYGGGYDRTQGM